MGLGRIKKEIALALALNKAEGAIEEGAKVGKFFPVVYGIIAAVLIGVTQSVTTFCPALETQWKVLIVGGLLSGFTAWSLRPKESAGFKATLSAIGAAVVGALYLKFESACPGIVAQLPTLIMGGITVGIGVYLKSHRQA